MASESEIEELENHFPYLADAAFSEARQQVLASGQSILEVQGTAIYRVFPDGTKEFVKPVKPRFKVGCRRFEIPRR